MKHEALSTKFETNSNQRRGQAALTVVIFLLFILLSILSAISNLSLKEAKSVERNFRSKLAFFSAEAGVEDATYRLKRNKNTPSSFALLLNGSSVVVSIGDVSNGKQIVASGEFLDSFRFVRATIFTGSGADFFYGAQVGLGGLEMENGSKVVGNVYSNGSIDGDNGAAITGNAIVAIGVAASPSIEWTLNDTNFLFATTSSSRDIAQSFDANTSGLLNKASVYIGKAGSPNNITLHVVADKNGKPNDSSLASATISSSLVGVTPSWINVSFANPPNLSSSTKYWIVLDYGSNSSANYWKWSKDSTDGYINNTGKYTADWNDKNATWKNVGGDLNFRIWIGGINNKIDTVEVGNSTSGTAYADLFINDIVHGAICPPTASQNGNSYCIDNQPQPQQPMPISDGLIQDFKDEATAGGKINGNYNIVDNISLGPKEITGDLNVNSNNKILTVTGTIYVRGNISIDNGSTIKCVASYSQNSCVILSDGWIHVANNSTFSGSGQSGSFILLLTTLACDGGGTQSPGGKPCGHHNGAIDLHNNATGAIFYAAEGLLNIHNGVGITEATAYKIHLNQNATVTYDQGLANMHFTSGPSGGWSISEWKEVIQ